MLATMVQSELRALCVSTISSSSRQSRFKLRQEKQITVSSEFWPEPMYTNPAFANSIADLAVLIGYLANVCSLHFSSRSHDHGIFPTLFSDQVSFLTTQPIVSLDLMQVEEEKYDFIVIINQ